MTDESDLDVTTKKGANFSRLAYTTLADCTNWVEIYSQTGPSRFAKDGCTLADCNVYIDAENFIDFNQLDDVDKYHFKIVWDEGQSLELEF